MENFGMVNYGSAEYEQNQDAIVNDLNDMYQKYYDGYSDNIFEQPNETF